MNMAPFYETIRQIGYIPAAQSDAIRDPSRLAHALVAGGMDAIQVDLVDAAAAPLVAELRSAEPSLLVGVGRVSSLPMLEAVAESGAAFAMLPTYDVSLCDACMAHGIPCIPTTVDEGAVFKCDKMGLTVTGIVTAVDRDAIGVIDTFARAFVGHRFLAVGDVDASNIGKYLSDEAVLACCSQDWVTPTSLLEGEAYDEIERRAAEASRLVGECR